MAVCQQSPAIAVTFCARNVPYLSGRVLVQTSLRQVHDRDAIIKHCLTYAAGFEQAGVPRDRFAIKLPFSGSAVSAALELNAQGIRTLATAAFSLEQAIAASQSNCLFISPYYNGNCGAFRPVGAARGRRPSSRSIHPNHIKQRDKVCSMIMQHPMSARVVHILKIYTVAYARTGKERPILVIASHFNTAEILAMAELGSQDVTVQAQNLQKLMETPDTLPPVVGAKPKHPYADFVIARRLQTLATLDLLAGLGWDGVLATMDTDFVADGGAKCNRTDANE